MKIKKIEEIAEKIQIKLSSEEKKNYSLYFRNLSRMIKNFEETKIEHEKGPMERVEIGEIKLSELKNISSNFSSKKISLNKAKKNCSSVKGRLFFVKKEKKKD